MFTSAGQPCCRMGPGPLEGVAGSEMGVGNPGKAEGTPGG